MGLTDYVSINKLTPRKLVDYFVGDMLLPTTNKKKTLTAVELYDTFERYCDANGLANPCVLNGFAMMICKRFQRVRRNKQTYYFCEYKDDVLYEEVQDTKKKVRHGWTEPAITNAEKPRLGSNKN